jgi:hypothetical protein
MRSRLQSCFLSLLGTLSLCSLSTQFAAAAELDLDGDNKSDLVYVKVLDDEAIRWRAVTSVSDFTESITAVSRFGELGDHLIPASWISKTDIQIAKLSRTNEDNVRWTLRDPAHGNPSFIFGDVKDHVLAGGDYNGNGYRDAALIAPGGATSVLTDAFGETFGLPAPQLVEGKFPRQVARKGSPFFLSLDGLKDSLAFLQKKTVTTPKGRVRRQIVLHYVSLGKRVATSKFYGKIPGTIEQVMPVMASNGRDGIVVVSVDGNRRMLTVWSVSRERLLSREIAKDAFVVVGNYLAAPGEEVVIVNAPNADIINPFTSTTGAMSGLERGMIPVDAVNIVRFAGSPTGNAPAGGLGAVCSSIEQIHSGILWKPESDVGDNRGGKPVVLFTDGNKTGTEDIKIYATDGTEVCNFTFREPDEPGVNNNSDPYYSGWHGGCDKTGSQIASAATAATGKREVYLQWKNGSCVGPLDPAGRHGSI